MKGKVPARPGHPTGKTGPRRRPKSGRRPPSPHSKRPSRVGGIIGETFPTLGIASRIREYRIKKLWPGIAGEAVSRRTAPLRLIGKTLHCIVSTSAWMTELNYQKPLIISKINEVLGAGAVADIIFKPGNVPEPPRPTPPSGARKRELSVAERIFIEKTTSVIKDPGLKRLISGVMEKSKS